MEVIGNQVSFILELKVNSDRMVKGISPLIVDAIDIAKNLNVVVAFTYEGYDIRVGPSDNHEDAIAAYRAMVAATADCKSHNRDKYVKEKEEHVKSVLKNHPVGRYVPEEQLEFGGARRAHYSFSVDNAKVKDQNDDDRQTTEDSKVVPPLGTFCTSEQPKVSIDSGCNVDIGCYRAIPTAFGIATVPSSSLVLAGPVNSLKVSELLSLGTTANRDSNMLIGQSRDWIHYPQFRFSSVTPGSGLNVNADSYSQLGINLLSSPLLCSMHINRTGEIKVNDLSRYAVAPNVATPEVRDWRDWSLAMQESQIELKSPQPPTKEGRIMPEKTIAPEKKGNDVMKNDRVSYVKRMTNDEILAIVKKHMEGIEIEQCNVGSPVDTASWYNSNMSIDGASWNFTEYHYRVKRSEYSGFINVNLDMLHATPEAAERSAGLDAGKGRIARLFVRFKEGDRHTTHIDADQK